MISNVLNLYWNISLPLPVILSMEVRHEHLDDQTPIVQPTHSQAFSSKPVAVQNLVGKTVQREFVERRVEYWSPGKDAGSSSDDPVIKEVTVGQNFPE